MPSHYEIEGWDKAGIDAMAHLRVMFKDGPDSLNFVLFSTSGIHGSYCTIEDCERGKVEDVTFLVIHPRLVAMEYGNVTPKNVDDFAFLKKLRADSLRAINSAYGVPP